MNGGGEIKGDVFRLTEQSNMRAACFRISAAPRSNVLDFVKYIALLD